jgi:hypothetical protein
MRKLLALLGVAFVVALLPIPASASGHGGPGGPNSPCAPTPNGGSGGAGCTITVKGFLFDLGPSYLFGCPTLPSGEVLGIVNGIFHVNINAAGDNWTTSTLTGSFTIVSSGAVLASGHLETWFGQENNLTNSVGNAVSNLSGTNLVTGQAIKVHIEQHAFFDPTGQIVLSGHSNVSCG